MESVFIGTCACNYSKYEHRFSEDLKDNFDNDARRASSLLIENRILLDCGPHASDALHIVGVGLEDITDIVITHLHPDHFISENIERIASAKSVPLYLWVSEDAELPEIKNVNVKRMKKFKTYNLSENIKITGLSANHDPQVAPQHLLIESNGKKLLYACDGAWMMTATFNYLSGSKLDAIVFDATVGDYEGDFRMAEHNSIPMIRLMIPSLKTKGIIADNTAIYLSHIAPSLHKSHEETVKIAEKDGFTVAFDGMKINI